MCVDRGTVRGAPVCSWARRRRAPTGRSPAALRRAPTGRSPAAPGDAGETPARPAALRPNRAKPGGAAPCPNRAKPGSAWGCGRDARAPGGAVPQPGNAEVATHSIDVPAADYLSMACPLRSVIGIVVGPSTPVSIRVLLTIVVARRSKIVLVISSTNAIAPL